MAPTGENASILTALTWLPTKLLQWSPLTRSLQFGTAAVAEANDNSEFSVGPKRGRALKTARFQFSTGEKLSWCKLAW
jgi:hypothetical protein